MHELGSPLIYKKEDFNDSIEIFFSSEEKHTFKVPPAMIYLREKEIMPTQRHHRTIFIWLANSPISDVIRILDDSILWCEQAWI